MTATIDLIYTPALEPVMDRSLLVTRPREYLPSLVAGMVMAIAIPACMFLHGNFRFPFVVPVNIWEMGDAGMSLSFPSDGRFVARILLLTVVLNLVFWCSFKWLLGRTEAPKRFTNVMEVLALLAAIAGAIGAVYHWGFDRASSMYRLVQGYDSSNVLSFLYFNDEYLGHHLQHLALVAYFVVLVMVEARVQKERAMHLDELLFACGITGVIAVTNGYAALHSESAVIVLVVSIVLFAIQLVLVAIRRVFMARSPLFLALLAGNVLVIIQGVFFIAAFGLSPWYPFLRPA